jgi:transposase InsO family protein
MDRVNRQVRAPMPNQPWISDFTYVTTWHGFFYVAFVIDSFANKIDRLARLQIAANRHWLGCPRTGALRTAAC